VFKKTTKSATKGWLKTLSFEMTLERLNGLKEDAETSLHKRLTWRPHGSSVNVYDQHFRQIIATKKPKFHLVRHVTSRYDTTRSTCRASRDERVQPFCSTSSTPPKWMGSTGRTDEPSGIWAIRAHGLLLRTTIYSSFLPKQKDHQSDCLVV